MQDDLNNPICYRGICQESGRGRGWQLESSPCLAAAGPRLLLDEAHVPLLDHAVQQQLLRLALQV